MTVLTHTVPGNAAWSAEVARGRDITFTAAGDRPNLSVLLFAARHPVDRLNVPDTLKAQYSACVRPPMVLMSDRGVGLASVTGSSLPWHDALCAHSAGARKGFLSELRKNGRDEFHLHGCVNLFSKVALSDSAGLSFVEEYAVEGDWVRLRAETELLLVCSTAAHPLDPAPDPAPVRVEITPAPPAFADDPSRTFRAESARALDAAEALA